MIRLESPFRHWEARFAAIAILFLTANGLSAKLWISEFMAENESAFLDDYGDYSDWIELFNESDEVTDLAGYYLSDDPDEPKKFALPKVRLDPRAFYVVFASGRNGPLEGIFERLRNRHWAVHLPFKLKADGEYLALYRPDGSVEHAYTKPFPKQFADMSYGLSLLAPLTPNVGKCLPGFLKSASPESPNVAHWKGFIKPLYASESRGFFNSPFELRLETSTPGAQIYYTQNGADPTPRNGLLYEGGIIISGTTTLKAKAFLDDCIPSKTFAATYLFPGDIVHQSDEVPPAGWPGYDVNGQRLDYGMDPEIVGGLHSEREVVEAITALPAVSLVSDIDNFFGARRGVYTNPQNKGRQWERPVSCELIYPDGTRGFQIDAGMRVRGGYSRRLGNAKHALRLIFRKEYGEGKLRYALFGDEGVKEFDHIDLRTSLNYSWAEGSQRNTFLRDLFCRDTQGAMGQPYTRSRFYNLFINGHYWGIYMTQERPVGAYAASYMGGEPEDYDVVKTQGELNSGTMDAQRAVYQMARRGFRDDEAYYRAQGLNLDGSRNDDYPRYIDVDNVIDFMILTYFSGNMDGPGNPRTGFPNNYYQVFNHKNPDGWKFFAHDMEHTFDCGGDLDFPGYYRWRPSVEFCNGHWLHDQLAQNPNYVKRFQQRVDKHLFGNGALSRENALARLDARSAQIDKAIIANSARWGDCNSGRPRTRQDWLRAVAGLRDFISNRHKKILSDFIRWGLYEGIEPPEFLERDEEVYLTSREPVRIYYTLDGVDPRGEDGVPVEGAQEADPPVIDEFPLVGMDSVARVWAPGHGLDDAKWFLPEYDDRSWDKGLPGIGYDDDGDYLPIIRHDVGRSMRSRTTTLYVRFPFSVEDLEELRSYHLTLEMKCDDGFVAFINGNRIADLGAPPQLSWQAASMVKSNDNQSQQFQTYAAGVTLMDALHAGQNLLAIQGLNVGLDSSDLLIIPRLRGTRVNGGKPFPKDAEIIARSFNGERWSPPVSRP